MDRENRDEYPDDQRAMQDGGNRRFAMLGIILVVILIFLLFQQLNGATKIEYSDFLKHVESDHVQKVLIGERKLTGEFKTGSDGKKTGIKGANGKELQKAFYVNIGQKTPETLKDELEAVSVDCFGRSVPG